MKADILIVDDSIDMLEVLRRQLKETGYTTFQASNVVDAVDLLKINLPSLLITDIQMPGVDGMQLVKYSRKHFPQLPILVITGYPTVDTALEVMRDGAVDYLVKPFTQAELDNAIQKVFSQQPLIANTPAKDDKDTTKTQSISGIIGKAKALESTLHLIEKTKDNSVTVLITGESGTGKELVARAIHYNGVNKNRPFIAVNCGAIPENLMESELFGYEKGAFTGAVNSRNGFFQAAEGGTIFLDEIGNAPLLVQQRLLRVIQEKEVTKVGAQTSKKVNVRIIAATNNDLLAMSKNGSFREDLYYRLNVVNIELPPLRNRKEDVKLLSEFFIRKHGKELQKQDVQLTADALNVLENYNWPGNIRELENTIHRALIVCEKLIDIHHLPDVLHSSTSSLVVNETLAFKSLKEVEKEHILSVLNSCENNKTKAAEILGITRKTLGQKLL